MGLDLDGLEPEAEDVWTMLNDMSTNDPGGYDRFVAEQMEAMKEEEEQKATGTKKSDSDSKKRSIRPNAGFCVDLCAVFGGVVHAKNAHQTGSGAASRQPECYCRCLAESHVPA